MPIIKLIPNDYILKKHSDVAWSKWLQMVWNDIEWPVVISLGIFSLAIGVYGFMQYASSGQAPFFFWDSLYLSLQLFSLQVSFDPTIPLPILLQIARFLSPALAAYTLSQAFLEIFKGQLELFRLVRSNNHVVVCGLGRKGLLLTKDLRKSDQPVVIIEQESNNPYLDFCRELGVILIIGDARDNQILLKAGIRQAKRLIVVCGNDGINVEVAEQARRLLQSNRKKTLMCNIHIVDAYLTTMLKQRELTKKTLSPFRIELFNIYDVAARTLLRGVFDSNSKFSPHILVIGMGNLGESIVVHAARTWCLKNSIFDEKLLISVVDPAAQSKLEMLSNHFPILNQVCTFNCQEYQTTSPNFQKAILKFDNQNTNVYICFDDTLIGLQAGYSLLQLLHDQKAQIMIRMNEDSGLASFLRETISQDINKMKAFDLLEHTCRVEFLDDGSHDAIARAIHEDYKIREKNKGVTANENPNLVNWSNLSDEIKESNRRQADHMGVKLTTLGYGMKPWSEYGKEKFSFTSQEIAAMAKMEHERWCEDKKWDGWRYGIKRDNVRKLHPNLVPWETLSNDTQEKDVSAVKLIPILLARAGFQIYKIKNGDRT